MSTSADYFVEIIGSPETIGEFVWVASSNGKVS